MTINGESKTFKKPLIEQLAQWVLDFDSERITPDAALAAKLLILDSIGCALAAKEEDAYKRALRTLAALGGNPQCSVIGSRQRMPLPQTVMLNGILIRELDLNDVYVGPGQTGHPSDNIAVALSVGERGRSTGSEVLASVILGYEIYCRIQDLSVSAGSWDHVTASALAAPSIAGRLLKLNLEQLSNALALSAVHGNTLAAVRFGQLSNAKAMANAFVASQATLCTLLAAEDMTGPPTVLEGRGGLGQGVLSGADLDLLVAPLNNHFRICDVSIKAYPCIGTAQAMIEAVLQVRANIVDPRKIQQLELRMADIPFVRGQVQDQDRRHPTSRETADHSFYYLAAVALLDGELTPAQFEEDRWLDPAVKGLMESITIRTDTALNIYTPGSYPCVVQSTMETGQTRTVEVRYPKGHPQNRMSPGDVQAKFRGTTRSVVSETQQNEIISLALDLENIPVIDELIKRLTLV